MARAGNPGGHRRPVGACANCDDVRAVAGYSTPTEMLAPCATRIRVSIRGNSSPLRSVPQRGPTDPCAAGEFPLGHLKPGQVAGGELLQQCHDDVLHQLAGRAQPPVLHPTEGHVRPGARTVGGLTIRTGGGTRRDGFEIFRDIVPAHPCRSPLGTPGLGDPVRA